MPPGMSTPVPEILEGPRLPARVRDLPTPPARLYLHGVFPRGPSVAIVGTRTPTLAGEQYARHLAGVLARQGIAILSGGAAGIDTAAHLGALDVGGVTVVVAPSGFDRPYPAQNRELFQRIVANGGAFLSSHAPDVPALESSFFPRNRLLAALAHLLIVAEAPCRSGARNAARHARALGRPRFVVAHPPWSSRGTGWLVELGLGAQVLDQPKRVLAALAQQGLHRVPLGASPEPVPAPVEAFLGRGSGSGSSPRAAPAPRPPASDPDVERVAVAVENGATHPDEIAERTGFGIPRVQQLLLTLELEGVLVATPSNRGAPITRRKH